MATENQTAIKYLSLFSGIGAFEKAMQRLGINYDLVGYCEIDKYASTAYSVIHHVPETMNIGDITLVDETSLPDDIDFISYGFPCFVKDTMILTSDGYKPIQDVRVGDFVLTHLGRWREVTSTMCRDDAEIWNVSGFGILPTKTTSEHPYYVTKGNDFSFVKIKDIDDGYYSTIILPQEVDDQHTKEWWWLAGRYLADGWRVDRKDRDHGGRVVIACNDDKLQYLLEKIAEAGYHYNVVKEKTCNKIHIINNQLYYDLECFGKYAHGKTIPGHVMCLPKEKAIEFYNGYMSGDGRSDREEATSTSASVILGMCMIALRCGKQHPGVYYTKRPQTVEIEGRTCNQRDTYTFRISNTGIKSFEHSGYCCRKLNRPVPSGERGTVYNISVAEDESYIANGAIVHNCQDISIAGSQKGFTDDDGNKTRSGLFFDALRIIEHCQPKVAIAENVKNLVGKGMKKNFDAVLSGLDAAGYNNYYQVLNAKDYGTAQNRERVFIVSIRKDIDDGAFKFPDPVELDKVLLDYLDEDVDEKFYVPQWRVDILIPQLEEKGILDEIERESITSKKVVVE